MSNLSLTSRKAIERSGPDIHEELSVSWIRNPDKTYTKVTNVTHRDRKTGKVKPMKRLKPVSTGPFMAVNSASESDDQFEYLDFDGNPAYVYLKLMPSDDSTE